MEGNRSASRGGIPWWAAVVLVLVAALAGAGVFYVLSGGARLPVSPSAPPTDALLTDASADNPNSGLPPEPADLVGRIRPAVVSIRAINVDGSSVGSGFLFDDQGRVLTNAHVVKGATEITVVDALGQRYPARPIGYDATLDVALLEVDGLRGRPPLELGDSRGVRQGDEILAFGSPLGFANTVTNGIISATNRDLTPFGSTAKNLMQMTAPIAEGSSGGPVVDRWGRVIGIAVAFIDTRLASNMGFAIPINDVRDQARDWAALGRTVALVDEPAATNTQLLELPQPESDKPAELALVRIAAMVPKSGSQAGIGLEIAAGAQLAVDQAKEELEKLGVRLEFFSVDHEDSLERGQGFARLLAADPSVYGVVGPVSSNIALAIGDMFEQAELAWVSPINKNAALGDKGWRTFHRLVAPDSRQAPAAAMWAWKRLKARQAYLLHDGTAYGSQLAESFGASFKQLGGEILSTESVTGPMSGDLATRLLEARPDVIYFGGGADHAGQLLPYLRTAGYGGPLIGPSDLDQQAIVEVAGKTATNVYFTDPLAHQYPSQLEFLYLATYRRQPTVWSAYGYDAGRVLVEAVASAARKSSGQIDRKAVVTAVRQVRHDGMIGAIEFDEAGENRQAPIYIFKYTGTYPAELAGQLP